MTAISDYTSPFPATRMAQGPATERMRELTTEEFELIAGGGWANFVNNVTTLASKTIPVTSAVGFAFGGPAGAGLGAVIGASAALGAAVGTALSD